MTRFARTLMISFALLAGGAVAGCSGGPDEAGDAAPADTLTRAQRDSMIGASSLPGAGAVRRAIGVADSAAARAAARDSLLRLP